MSMFDYVAGKTLITSGEGFSFVGKKIQDAGAYMEAHGHAFMVSWYKGKILESGKMTAEMKAAKDANNEKAFEKALFQAAMMMEGELDVAWLNEEASEDEEKSEDEEESDDGTVKKTVPPLKNGVPNLGAL